MKIKDLGILNRTFGKKIVHVEAPHLFGNQLKNHVLKYNSLCYCICPENYSLLESFFAYEGDKKELYIFLKNYYLELKKYKVDLQLHVHLAMFPKKLSYNKKNILINSAYNFFKDELQIIPKEIVFGWWVYDKEAEEIAKSLGLKIVGRHLHIYDWWLK